MKFWCFAQYFMLNDNFTQIFFSVLRNYFVKFLVDDSSLIARIGFCISRITKLAFIYYITYYANMTVKVGIAYSQEFWRADIFGTSIRYS